MSRASEDEEELQRGGEALSHIHFRPAAVVLLTALIMGALTVFVYALWIPNPNIFLLSGLVVCSSLFGYPGGVTAGIFMLLYTLFFFSTDHDFVTFTTQNLQKVWVSVFGIVADVAIISRLKAVENAAYRRLEELTRLLRENNRLLEKASLTDPLTELGNRFAMQRSFDFLRGRQVILMMVDVDDFKRLNDAYGHEIGDACLRETGRSLASLFGAECAFRFGGDEFVVLCADMTREEFDANVRSLLESPPAVIAGGRDGEQVPLSYSAGYVIGACNSEEDLERMFRQADRELYRAKSAGKNRSSAGEYRSQTSAPA